jgi:hypothetical protein
MDTKLFLDAYPHDMTAMEYFNQLLEKRDVAAAAYHRKRTACCKTRNRKQRLLGYTVPGHGNSTRIEGEICGLTIKNCISCKNKKSERGDREQ